MLTVSYNFLMLLISQQFLYNETDVLLLSECEIHDKINCLSKIVY